MDRQKLIAFFEQGIPFHVHTALKVDRLEVGHCRLRLPFSEQWVGDPFRPALHGGILSFMADSAGGLAVFSTLSDPNKRTSTVDLRIDYLRPGRLEELLCDATVIRGGNRVAVTSMVLHHGEPEADKIAEARAVYNIVHLQNQQRAS